MQVINKQLNTILLFFLGLQLALALANGLFRRHTEVLPLLADPEQIFRLGITEIIK
jgi:hypothetical protein